MTDQVHAGGAAAKPRRKHSLDTRLTVLRAIDDGRQVKDICDEFGLCPSVVHKWRKKFKTGGADALADRSTRPHRQPRKTSQWLIDKVLGLKRESPEMGAAKASEHLARFDAVKLSPTTVAKVFKKHGLPDGDAGAAEAAYLTKGDDGRKAEQALEADLGEWERFARPSPNDMWQMDIMSFYIRDAHRVYLISALDDCSRMIVGWGLFRQQTADAVLEVLRAALARFGAPGEVLTDRGAQFKCWSGVTQFEKLMKKLSIVHHTARSHHPQTCGKIEAYHKTIHRELLEKEFFVSQEQAVEKIARFVEHYNHARPHQSLGGYTPADRFFGVVDAVKRYLADIAPPKNDAEEAGAKIAVGRGSRVYLVGKALGHDVRLQEIAGVLSIHVGGQLWREVNLLS